MRYNYRLNWVSLILIPLFLNGCKSEEAFSNLGKQPQITVLELSHYNGALIPVIECTLCDTSRYQYSWIINGTEVSTAQNYTFTDDDVGYDVQIKVSGEDAYGQTTSAYSTYRVSLVHRLYSTYFSFSALKTDGSVVTWGGVTQDNATGDLSTGVKSVVAGIYSYAALKRDGSVVYWGADSVSNQLLPANEELVNIKALYANDSAYAALKNDGSVLTWGEPSTGGDSSNVDLSSGVMSIYSANRAFAAFKEDGTVVSWGLDGLDSIENSSGLDFSSGIKEISTTGGAFAVIKNNGDVVAWGNELYGGALRDDNDFSGGVRKIVSNNMAFAAIKNDNTIQAWGNESNGGIITFADNSNIKEIYANGRAFVALKYDNTIQTWGNSNYGGNLPQELNFSVVKSIHSTDSAFTAILDDDSVISWGDPQSGGDNSQVNLAGGLKFIFGASNSFLGIKRDDSIVSWGGYNDPNYYNVDFSSGIDKVEDIASNPESIAIKKKNGEVIAWGPESAGGSTAQVEFELMPSLTLLDTSI